MFWASDVQPPLTEAAHAVRQDRLTHTRLITIATDDWIVRTKPGSHSGG
ncbi:hypothetical protein PSAB6_50062 [Paraburkholderia sabiae]|nr:hypothetical protein PSAB6_50062 [Paraburkholderia sabiae]